jgi:nucleotide-binding universal stress UspA family protein
MSQLFQKILCPIDFDDQRTIALDFTRTLALRTGGRVFALHVVSMDAEVDHTWQKGVVLQLRQLVDERFYPRIDYEFIVRTGPVAAEVLKAAEDFGADLIIIPTHARLGIKRLVIGSIAEQVIRAAKTPVLTLKQA